MVQPRPAWCTGRSLRTPRGCVWSGLPHMACSQALPVPRPSAVPLPAPARRLTGGCGARQREQQPGGTWPAAATADGAGNPSPQALCSSCTQSGAIGTLGCVLGCANPSARACGKGSRGPASWAPPAAWLLLRSLKQHHARDQRPWEARRQALLQRAWEGLHGWPTCMAGTSAPPAAPQTLVRSPTLPSRALPTSPA